MPKFQKKKPPTKDLREEWDDQILKDINKLSDEEFFTKHKLYKKPFKNVIDDFETNRSRRRAFEDYEAKSEALSSLIPEYAELSRKILKQEL